ncbi:MAG: ABC transporter permease [Solirubrobacterales bacterium]
MGVLTRRTIRLIGKTRGQFIAVVAVMTLGIAVFISMTTAYGNLTGVRDKFYRQYDFADYYFQVVRAPREITRQVAAVPGVTMATGRIQQDVALLRDNDARAIARIVSYPIPMEREVNRLHLMSGRMFEENPSGNRVEVLTDVDFFKVNGLKRGGEISVISGGKKAQLTVVGTAIAPEFIYPMKDAASMYPEPKRFAIVMMPHQQAEQVLGMSGQINQIVIRLAPGADEEHAARRIKEILKPYGNIGSYPRKYQLSDAVIKGELDGLRANSIFMPVIFLGLATVIQFLMLGRMIRAQRLEIGIMKAVGYSNAQIVGHYTSYSVAAGLTVAVLGGGLGIALGSAFTNLYAVYFKMPTEGLLGINTASVFGGAALAIAVGAAAGLIGSWKIVKIRPAEAMRPEPPRAGVRNPLEFFPALWGRLHPAWKLTLRSIARNRARFTLTLIGVIFAVGLLIISLFIGDSVDYMLNQSYYRDQRYDYMIRFSNPVSIGDLSGIERIGGVRRLEPQLEVPVKLKHQGRSQDSILVGVPLGQKLRGIQSPEGLKMTLPASGMFLDENTARKIGAKTGDTILAETQLNLGAPRTVRIRIVGIHKVMIGSGGMVSLEEANRILGVQQTVTAAVLTIDPSRRAQVESELEKMTRVSSVISREDAMASFQEQLGMMNASIAILVTFALILGFAIVYNSAIITFYERTRELGAFRVIGYHIREVSAMMGNEVILQAVFGIALGLPFGSWLSGQYMKAMSTDLFTIVAVIYPKTYVLTAIFSVLFIWAAHAFAVRGVSRLDLVETMKNKD